MGLQQQLAQGLFPIGSTRRRKLVEAARSAGLVSKPIPTDYERWVERVEPHLWSAQVDNADDRDKKPDLGPNTIPHFLVEVTCDTSTSPADITATTISLVDQSYHRWAAVLRLESCSPETTNAARRAIESDDRIRSSSSELQPGILPEGSPFVISIEGGATLAIRGLNELAVALGAFGSAEQRSAFVAVVADADSLVPVTRRREFPLLVPPLHVDLVEQCDLRSALFAQRADNQTPLSELIHAGAVAYSPRIVLHRKRTQPPQAALLAAKVDSFANGGGPGSGTRVRHRCMPGTTVEIVVRDPFDGSAGAQHRAKLQTSVGDRTTIESMRDWYSCDAFPAHSASEVTVVIDGSVTPTESGWLDDIVGALLRPHVLAVAPLILAPSGVAFDAGVELTNTGTNTGANVGDSSTVSLKVRSGRLDFPPYAVARVSPVSSLSMRAVAMRNVDVSSLATFTSRDLYALSRNTQRTCLVWAHQRWRMDASLDGISPLTPALAAWKEGRLGQWVDPTIEPHHPAVARVGEGVW